MDLDFVGCFGRENLSYDKMTTNNIHISGHFKERNSQYMAE